VARHRGWTVGQRVVLPGLKQVEREVSGFLDITQGPDDRFLFLPLEDAQFLFNHTNELTHILVRLNDPNQMDNVVGALRGCNAGMQMNIVPLAHLFRTIQSMVNSTRWFLGCVTLVGLLAAATGVSASLLIAVAERTCEIGVLRALGASRPDIFRLFWMESVQTCLVGGSVGVLAGRLVMGGVEGWLRGQLPFVPDSRLMTWEWGIVGGCLGLALILGTLSAWLPAWRAANLAPMAAIRSKGGSW